MYLVHNAKTDSNKKIYYTHPAYLNIKMNMKIFDQRTFHIILY